jgi:hypothetical protein
MAQRVGCHGLFMRSAEASRYVSAVTRSFMKTDGGTSTASPSPDTPKSLCNVSGERDSIRARLLQLLEEQGKPASDRPHLRRVR